MLEDEQVYYSSIFQKLMNKKKLFISYLTLFFFTYYFSLPILTSYYPNVMTYKLFGSINFAWLFALTQFIMTGIICLVYYKKSKSIDVMVERIKSEQEGVDRGYER